MPRGSVPMRVRRRQSDAKWRASVAICYETLKQVIPDNDKMSKRKISKALILQETRKHISNLESHLKELLENKAKNMDKVVLYETERGVSEATLNDVRNDFIMQQQHLYILNCSQQRKRSNVPSDMEIGLIKLRGAHCEMKVVPTQNLDHVVADKNIDQQILEDYCSMDVDRIFDVNNDHIANVKKEGRGKQSSRILNPDVQYVPEVKVLQLKENAYDGEVEGEELSLYDPDIMYDVTPSKPDFGVDSTSTPKNNFDLYFHSPSKGEVRYVFPSDVGITPIKISEDAADHHVPLSPASLITLQEQVETGGYEIDIEDLLCTESIELMNLEDEVATSNQTTPRGTKATHIKQRGRKRDNTHRGPGKSLSEERRKSQSKQPKCRRKLESVFQEGHVKKSSATCSLPDIGDLPMTLAKDMKQKVSLHRDHTSDGHESSTPVTKKTGLTQCPKTWKYLGSYLLYQDPALKGKQQYITIHTTPNMTQKTCTDAAVSMEIVDNSKSNYNTCMIDSGHCYVNLGDSAAEGNMMDSQIVPDNNTYENFEQDFPPLDLNATDELGFFTISNSSSTQTSDHTCSDGGTVSLWDSQHAYDWSSQTGTETTCSSAYSSQPCPSNLEGLPTEPTTVAWRNQVVPEFECVPVDIKFITI